ncbi:MAG TPA: glutathione peroxidase [Chitinophagaceae bacterium]|nr:glutathione peroxidase [Chitinophagaceae bacterium]
MKQKNKITGWLKNLFIVLFLFIVAFGGTVAFETRNTKNMTLRQKILKTVYPAFTWWNKLVGSNNKVFSNVTALVPSQPIYDLSITLNSGEVIPLSKFKGKKLMLVNTASDCGYTDQYSELQKLYMENENKLVVIGFPANDFKEQEKRTDEEIEQFCKINYGVTFPLVMKSTVITGPEQHPVFQWLTNKSKNGWTNKKPSWNFSKYLVNEEGVLINYFDPSISPVSREVQEAIKK